MNLIYGRKGSSVISHAWEERDGLLTAVCRVAENCAPGGVRIEEEWGRLSVKCNNCTDRLRGALVSRPDVGGVAKAPVNAMPPADAVVAVEPKRPASRRAAKESLAREDCPNRAHGCHVRATVGQLDAHAPYCRYHPAGVPLPAPRATNPDPMPTRDGQFQCRYVPCSEVGSKLRVRKHMKRCLHGPGRAPSLVVDVAPRVGLTPPFDVAQVQRGQASRRMEAPVEVTGSSPGQENGVQFKEAATGSQGVMLQEVVVAPKLVAAHVVREDGGFAVRCDYSDGWSTRMAWFAVEVDAKAYATWLKAGKWPT